MQEYSIGPVLEGNDAIILAQTGSGKTLSYLLPVFASLRPANSVQALVLLPLRELATQVTVAGGARRAADCGSSVPGRCLCVQRRWCKTEPLLLHPLPPLPPRRAPQSAAVLSEELPLAARRGELRDGSGCSSRRRSARAAWTFCTARTSTSQRAHRTCE